MRVGVLLYGSALVSACAVAVALHLCRICMLVMNIGGLPKAHVRINISPLLFCPGLRDAVQRDLGPFKFGPSAKAAGPPWFNELSLVVLAFVPGPSLLIIMRAFALTFSCVFLISRQIIHTKPPWAVQQPTLWRLEAR